MEGSEYDDPLRRLRPGTSHGFSNLNNDQVASDEPAIGRRIFRNIARFFFVVLIGVSITLAWQSYREESQNLGSAAGLVVTANHEVLSFG